MHQGLDYEKMIKDIRDIVSEWSITKNNDDDSDLFSTIERRVFFKLGIDKDEIQSVIKILSDLDESIGAIFVRIDVDIMDKAIYKINKF